MGNEKRRGSSRVCWSLLLLLVLSGCAQVATHDVMVEVVPGDYSQVEELAHKLQKAPSQMGVSNIDFDSEESASDRADQGESVVMLTAPLVGDVQKRISRKPFGIKIDPATSPVQPERFRGYHTGVDFEVTQEELSQDMDVFAICDGAIVRIDDVSGYGGVITQLCPSVNAGGDVYVLYGHISRTDTVVTQGQSVSAGSKITELGDHLSAESGGERKHLHLGISRTQDVRGYVQDAAALEDWFDFQNFTL